MLKVVRIILILLIILLSCQFSFGQQGRIDREKRLFDGANGFYARGDYRNALQDYNTIINSYAGGNWADDALLRVAIYYNEIEKNPTRAKENLQRIFTSYANTNSAPEAYFYLGKLILTNSRSLREINDARANFARVYTLFPESSRAAEAVLMVARIEKKNELFQDAIDRLYLLLSNYPHDDIADVAQFDLATNYYHQGEYVKSMLEYQKVIDNYPDSFLATKAKDHITLIFRLHVNRAKGRPVFFPDENFKFSQRTTLDDPVYLQHSEDLKIYLVDRGSGKVQEINHLGKPVYSETTRRPAMMKNNSQMERFLLRDGRVRNKRKSIELQVSTSSERYELENVKSFALSSENDLYVFDEGRAGLYRFSQQGKFLWQFKNESFRDLWDMEVNSFGNLFTLNGSERKLTKYEPIENRRVTGMGPVLSGIELRDPVCLEIDELDNLYILDRRLKGVFVLDRKGKLIARYYFPNEIREARSLAVDSSGAIYLLDRREKDVYRYH
jgi:TolA-binding protein